MSKYKIGDKVRVISNINHHFFNIGDIITLVEKLGTDGWDCQNEGREWSLSENEFESVNVSSEVNIFEYPKYQKYVLKEELKKMS